MSIEITAEELIRKQAQESPSKFARMFEESYTLNTNTTASSISYVQMIRTIGKLRELVRENQSPFERRFTLRNFVIPMELRIQMDLRPDGYNDWMEVSATIQAPDRDTGRIIPLTFGRRFPIEPFQWEHRWPRLIRNFLIEVLTHEVDEAIHLDGKRIFDPHAPAVSTTPPR